MNDALQSWAEHQFHLADGGWTYRRAGKGAAFLVSAEQKDRYLANYRKIMRHSRWILISGIFLGILVFLFFKISNPHLGMFIVGLGPIGSIAYSQLSFIRFRGQFEIELSSSPVSPALSLTQARRNWAERTSYLQIFIIPFSLAFLTIQKPLSDFGKFWDQVSLAFAFLIVVSAFLIAYWKWRLTR